MQFSSSLSRWTYLRPKGPLLKRRWLPRPITSSTTVVLCSMGFGSILGIYCHGGRALSKLRAYGGTHCVEELWRRSVYQLACHHWPGEHGAKKIEMRAEVCDWVGTALDAPDFQCVWWTILQRQENSRKPPQMRPPTMNTTSASNLTKCKFLQKLHWIPFSGIRD